MGGGTRKGRGEGERRNGRGGTPMSDEEKGKRERRGGPRDMVEERKEMGQGIWWKRERDGGRAEMEGDLADRRMEREEVERGKGKGKGRGGMGNGGRERRKSIRGKG
jgi:hypothetical protein